MSVTLSHVRDIFKSLGAGDGSEFLYPRCRQRRLDGEGTHPLAGHYQSKADFLTHTFEKLAQVLPQGTQLQVQHALASGEWTVVEMRSLATAQSGMRFDNRYCWVCRFSADKIVEVRAYLDSVLVARLFDENPILCASGSSTTVSDPVIFTALDFQNTCFTSRTFDATVSSNSVVFPSNINLPIASA